MKANPYLFFAGSGGGQNPAALQRRVYAKNGIFYDATGPRKIQGYTDMPGLRIWNDNRPEGQRTFQSAAKAQRQVVRVAYGLAENETDYNEFWKGAMVLPELAQGNLVSYADAAANAGIKLHLFGGHNYGSWTAERAFIQWMADALHRAGHDETVALFEWRNEYPLTSPYGEAPIDPSDPYRRRLAQDLPKAIIDTLHTGDTYDHGAEACQIMRDALGCICTLGSPGDDDDAIIRSVEFTEVAGIDFERGLPGAQMMKRYHRAYYDGRFHGKYLGRAEWNTEPTGPDEHGGDVYLPLNDHAYVYGIHAIDALTGIACSYFSGASVRHRYALDTDWGWAELPKLLAFIPEDIGEWAGPTWFTKGKQFVTAVAEEWQLLEHPPKPIASWMAQFYDGTTVSNEGPIALEPGWKACIVRGEFQ